jgi:hypothetical protein
LTRPSGLTQLSTLPKVTWLKNNASLADTRFTVSNDNSLLFSLATKEDSGRYVCVATNAMDMRYSKPAKLSVLGRLRPNRTRLTGLL